VPKTDVIVLLYQPRVDPSCRVEDVLGINEQEIGIYSCEALWLFAHASYGSNFHVSRAEVATYIFTSNS